MEIYFIKAVSVFLVVMFFHWVGGIIDSINGADEIKKEHPVGWFASKYFVGGMIIVMLGAVVDKSIQGFENATNLISMLFGVL